MDRPTRSFNQVSANFFSLKIIKHIFSEFFRNFPFGDYLNLEKVFKGKKTVREAWFIPCFIQIHEQWKRGAIQLNQATFWPLRTTNVLSVSYQLLTSKELILSRQHDGATHGWKMGIWTNGVESFSSNENDRHNNRALIDTHTYTHNIAYT